LQAVVLGIFFLSGASALVYEVVWMRELALVFGVTTFAVTTVLATFMGGLALGSYSFGRRADHLSRLLAVYALLEVGIGLYALCVPFLIDGLRFPYILLHRLDLPYSVVAMVRALLAALVLLPPTFLMGGTFPVLARLFVLLRRDVGSATALLYFFNTAGALVGCALAGFVLIEHLGLNGTTRLAAATNLALALAVIAIARVVGGSDGDRAPAAEPSGRELARVSPSAARIAFVCIGLSGFASLAYEVLWTRALLRYVHNSTYAFTIMLTTFLAGIAIGSWLYALLPGRRRRPVLLFAALQLGVGLGFVISSLLFVDLSALSAQIMGDARVQSFGQSLTAMFVRASLILLGPAILLGASLPLATEICARSYDTVAHTIGRVYAVNTLGSILGSVFAAFVLIPLLGMQGTLTLLIALNLAMAGTLAAAGLEARGARLAAGAASATLLVGLLLLLPSDLFRRTFAAPGQELVFYQEGATDTVGVVQMGDMRVIAYEDRRGTASTTTYPMNYLLGHIPVLLHPGEPSKGLHICFGVGNSLSAMAVHESIERIDSVELSPQAIDAAPYFWTNDDVLSNPVVRTIVDDGRNFVLTSDEIYDVIELEPPEIFTAGVINLYTRDFYQDLAERLAPDGILVQWVPIGEAALDEERMLLRAFYEVFPHATAWQELYEDGPLLLVASKRPLRIDYRRLGEKMRRDRVRQDLELIGVPDPVTLLSMFVFDSAAFASFVEGVEPVTDDRTVLDFSMPRYLGSGFGLGSFNLEVAEDGEFPLQMGFERGRYYYEQRVSPVPSLTNLGTEDPRSLAQRIHAKRRPRWQQGLPTAIPEAEWKRW
jgi:spermidine synthase